MLYYFWFVLGSVTKGAKVILSRSRNNSQSELCQKVALCWAYAPSFDRMLSDPAAKPSRAWAFWDHETRRTDEGQRA